MIITETSSVDASDAASTYTLVPDEPAKSPRHLNKIICASLFVSLLTMVLSLVANVCRISGDNSTESGLAAPTVLAFVFTIPHHGAILLSNWLQRPQSESKVLLPTPYSPRGIAYSVVLVLLWISSTVACGISMNEFRNSYHFISCSFVIPPEGFSSDMLKNCRDVDPSLIQYWPSFSSIITSSVELILITSIAVICYMHRQHQPIQPPGSPPSNVAFSSSTISKVISA